MGRIACEPTVVLGRMRIFTPWGVVARGVIRLLRGSRLGEGGASQVWPGSCCEPLLVYLMGWATGRADDWVKPKVASFASKGYCVGMVVDPASLGDTSRTNNACIEMLSQRCQSDDPRYYRGLRFFYFLSRRAFSLVGPR